MSTSNMLDGISVYESAFTKSEKTLYQYLKTNINDIIYMSVTELAERIEVGESTILRFCRKVGFTGYQDFKLNVAQHMGIHQNIEVENDKSLNQIIADALVNSIYKSSMLINQEDLRETVGMINSANRVLFYGVGSSGVAAEEAKNRFMRIGRKYDAFTDSHFMMMISSTLGPGDLVVAFTLSGGTKDVVDACRVATTYGAKVIAITSYLKSPITKYAEKTILTSGREGPMEGGSLYAKISQLYIIDLLFSYTAQADLEQSKEYMKRIAQSIADKSY